MNKRSHYAYKLENKEMRRREEGEVHIYIEWTPPLAVKLYVLNNISES